MFFSSRNNDDLVLILDIQSGMARSALVLYKEGQVPKAMFVYSRVIPHRVSSSSKNIIDAILKATSNSIDEALRYLSLLKNSKDGPKNIPHKISSVHYILSSPWILSEAKRLEANFKSGRIVKEDMIFHMVSEEREKMAEDVKAKGKVMSVEEKIFDVKVNGYSITNWQNKVANSLSVSFVTSISGTKMVERFKDLCTHIVHGHKVFFHSSLLLQHIAINEINPKKETYVIIHAHSEITDIVEVDKHSCVYFSTYPIGTQTMLRMFAKESKMDIQTAASALNMHNAVIIARGSEKNAEYIEKVNERWFKQLEASLSTGPLPLSGAVTFIVSSQERQSDIAAIIRAKYPKSKIETLNIEEISSYVAYDTTTERQAMIGQYALSLGKLRHSQ